MGTWNSRGLRGSTLEEMVNWTNDHYLEFKGASRLHTGGTGKPHQRTVRGDGACADSEDTDPNYTGAHGRRSQTDHTGVF